MRVHKKTQVNYSKVVIPCPNCGHGCEVSLAYSGQDADPSSSSESDVEVKPPAKKTKLVYTLSSSESSDDSDPSSKLTAPVSKPVSPKPPKPIAPASRAQPLSSSSSDSSDSDSDSVSDAPVAAATPTKQGPVALKLRGSSSSSSSDSSDSELGSESSSSDSDSDSDSGKLPKPLQQSSVSQFFSQFPSFKYDSSQPVMTEYLRMSRTRGFKSLSQKARQEAKLELKDALAEDFGQLYGYDVNDLGAWQSLCRVLRFEDIPDDLEECQQLVTATYVNIIDLINTVSTGAPVQHFDSEQELSEYTIRTQNFLSGKSKHAGSLLRFLLRKIFTPSDATRMNPEPLYALSKKRKRRN
ncbi:unnamed protein product [Rhizoctonia solani]|uniref:Uncharacterized protein n=1 Tax=Rhizoctonia solani TaxID=456999 RepID=A0A8H3H3Y1_9AGAM|nr:unnamed protein product [Rhizoctonia solani]